MIAYKKLDSRCKDFKHILLFNYADGTTFIFASNEGVILFQWADFLPSRSDDKFAIGFSTTVRDSLLFKVTGSEYKRSRDFLELAIVSEELTKALEKLRI